MPVLKFVRCSDLKTSEKDLSIIDKAIQCARDHDIPLDVIYDLNSVESVVKSAECDNQVIYICFPFKGKVFEILNRKSCRIIGPQCVFSCLLLEVSVPKRLYPVCNVAMLGTVICCSSMKKDDRKVIHELVKLMAGDVTNDFTNSVTHLIAQEVGSKKYQVACARNIPCLLPSWVHIMWEKSHYEHILASSENILKEHLTPIFKGCTICVSGILDLDKRNSIKLLVNSNGGLYSGELNMKTCTHLLVEQPKGQKYFFARQWKIHCVKLAWLYDCLKEHCWLDEGPYKVEHENELSRLPGALQNDKVLNVVDESLLPSNMSRVEALAVKSMSNSKILKSVELDSTTYEKVCFKYFDPKTINVDEVELKDQSYTYFDGFKVYLCNITGVLFDICRKIINNAGGFRLNTLTDSITHIVFCLNAPKELRTYIKELGNHLPHVVSPLWLLDSAKNGEAMPEQDYSLMVSSTTNGDFVDFSTLNDVFTKPIQLQADEKKPVSTSLNFDDDDEDKDNDLLRDYLPNNHESTRLSQVFDTLMHKQQPFESNIPEEETAAINEETHPQAVLQNKKFSILRYDAEQSLRIKELIEEYSGLVINNHEQADHIIVPLTYNKKISINPKEATVCWLEQSIDSEELKDINSSYLYRPVFLADDIKPLKNCVVTVSQYTGMERQHLFHLAELLGAFAQDYFARRDSNDIVASTHLVLMKPEGSKYAASLKWNIPCVKQEWLFECAKTGKRISEVGFSLLPKELLSVDDEIKSKCILNVEKDIERSGISKNPIEAAYTCEVDSKNRLISLETEKPKVDLDFSNFNKIIADERKMQSGNFQSRISSSSPAISSVAGITNPLHLSFDFTDALEAVQSPISLSQGSFKRNRKSRGSLPFDIQFAEAMQKAVDKHVPEVDRNTVIKVVKNQNNSILHGVVLVVSKKLAQRQMELHKKALTLGAECRFLYDSECTHFVHQGRLNDSSKDYVEAKCDKKYLVSPYWLDACIDSDEHVDETLYPITFNPRMSLNVSTAKPSKEEEVNCQKVADIKNEKVSERLDFQKKMEQIMEATKVPMKEKRSRRTTFNNDLAHVNTRNGRRLSQNKSSNENIIRNDHSLKKQEDLVTEQSQSDYITYDDPGKSERLRILEQLKRVSPSQDSEAYYENLNNRNIILNELVEEKEPKTIESPTRPQNNFVEHQNAKTELNLIKETNNLSRAKNKENYKFLLSGMTGQEKINYAAIIEQLGGVVYDVQYFNVMCTHVVISVPNRNEKFLGSLASGKWVLHKSFLEASRESGEFVDEISHEWGSQPNASAFACSARRWRIDLAEKRKFEPSVGAFTGWVVLLCIEPSKQPGFSRMLEAGGAKLLCEKPPFDNISGATHAFIGDKKLSASLDFQALNAAGILVLKPEYISDYLTVFPIPSTLGYVVSDLGINKEPSASSKRTAASKRHVVENTSQQFTKRTRR